MPKNIFISYRREDNKYQALRIFDAFQKTNVRAFYDTDSIPLGRDFRKVIMAQVQKCDVLLALVGRNWAECLDPKTGLRRLENPDDFVRIEIGTALSRGIPVVPVLIDDASLPETDQLPNDLRNLFDMQAEFISFRTFDDDVKRLITKLKIKSPQKLEPSELASPVQDGEPPLGDRAAGYGIMGEVPIVARTQIKDLFDSILKYPLKDLFDNILKYPPQYLLTFANIFLGPKKFIAGRQLDSETEWMNALAFLTVSTVLSSIVLVLFLAPSESSVVWSGVVKLVLQILVLQLLFVGLGALFIRFSWWLVGGKAAARSFFVLCTYLISGLTIIVSVFVALAKELMPFAAIIWAVSFWGAFRSLTGSSKLRSFFAFMIFATLFSPFFLLIR